MELNDYKEFVLIDRIKKIIPNKSSSVILGIGDDAAVIRVNKDRYMAVSTDTMVEGVHFGLQYCSFYEVGQKLVISGISDLISTGAKPMFGLVSLGLSVRYVDKYASIVDNLYRGILKQASRYRVQIIGGDMVSSPENSIITLTFIL